MVVTIITSHCSLLARSNICKKMMVAIVWNLKALHVKYITESVCNMSKTKETNFINAHNKNVNYPFILNFKYHGQLVLSENCLNCISH